MAAHLKKRAMAEFASLSAAEAAAACSAPPIPTLTLENPSPIPSKRLKLVWKPHSTFLRDQVNSLLGSQLVFIHEKCNKALHRCLCDMNDTVFKKYDGGT